MTSEKYITLSSKNFLFFKYLSHLTILYHIILFMSTFYFAGVREESYLFAPLFILCHIIYIVSIFLSFSLDFIRFFDEKNHMDVYFSSMWFLLSFWFVPGDRGMYPQNVQKIPQSGALYYILESPLKGYGFLVFCCIFWEYEKYLILTEFL